MLDRAQDRQALGVYKHFDVFVVLDAHRPWRKVKVTEQRTAADFAQCMRELVDIDYPQAARIRVVLDNLSTHTRGRSTRRLWLQKRTASCGGWSSTSRPSMPAG